MSAQNTIAVIDYGSGNLRSAAKSFEHVINKQNLPFSVLITNKPEDIESASKIVLPGQGAFGDCMSGLSSIDGMIEALEHSVLKKRTPFMGICVGMQLLADEGLEHGRHKGLGWIPGKVVPIEPKDPSLKIPHMGWNDCYVTDAGKSHPLLQSITKSALHNAINFYFVHSFMFDCKDQDHVMAVTDYGQELTAIVAKDNIVGVQFHIEKSHNAGLDLITHFVYWTP